MSTSKFSTPFMEKNPLSPLKGNAFIKAKIDAEEAGKSSFTVDGKNYPLKMVKSPLDNKKTKKEKLEEKIEETRKKAFIRSNSPSEEYEESPEERRAQRKLARLEKRKKRKEQK